MNKKMLAMAVAAAMVAPMTAQADVQVYGKFKMGVAMVSDDTNSYTALTSDASRLGFKGSNELENGMTAIFTLEGEVFPDATGYTMGRNMFVGLKGGFGTVRLGHFDTAYKTTTAKMDPFGDTHADFSGDGFLGAFDSREANTVSYTNKFGDMKFGLDLHLDDATNQMGNSIGLTIPMGDHSLIVASTTEPAGGNSATKLGAAMKFAGTKVNFIYEMSDAAANGNTMVLNGTMGNLAFAYYSNDNTTDTQLSLGYFSKLDKSTKVGLVYTAISGNSDGRLDKGIDGVGTVGANPSSIQFVLHHNF